MDEIHTLAQLLDFAYALGGAWNMPKNMEIVIHSDQLLNEIYSEYNYNVLKQIDIAESGIVQRKCNGITFTITNKQL